MFIFFSNLMEFRSKYKDAVLEKHGVKLGFMSAFIKAACHAFAAVPEVNARIDGDEIVFHDFVDISVAVATPKGLVTPVIRNCEAMNMVQAERAMAEYAKKVKSLTHFSNYLYFLSTLRMGGMLGEGKCDFY
jgi:2-oxoglutarate dehydrogenase E2 component (dihydrolipoamide succinyltransferase)